MKTLCAVMFASFGLYACQQGKGPAPIQNVPSQNSAVRPSRFHVQDQSEEAFGHRFPDMNSQNRTLFFSGESLFDQSWVIAPSSTEARDGLGPFFNARSCAACHAKDGRSKPFDVHEQATEAILVRLSTKQGLDDPVYGGQLQPFAIDSLAGEGQLKLSWESIPGRFLSGESYTLMRPQYHLSRSGYGEFSQEMLISVRQSSQLVGLGLLEQIPEETIISQADSDDRDRNGISGRPNWVVSFKEQQKRLGRFGWKANQPTLEQQVAAAFSGDIGISSPMFPQRQESVHQAGMTAHLPNGGEPELAQRLLDRVTFYVQNLAVPIPRPLARDAQAFQLFERAQCAACHRPHYTISEERISPYTDLLLHDMGEELADKRPDGEANGQEWRTPPLWGVGLIPKVNGHSRYLHDGRARNLTEAILWHGGEGAQSRDAFKQMQPSERDLLIDFLEAL